MTVRLFLALCWLTVPAFVAAQTRTYTDAEARTAWAMLQRQPLTENTFRQRCDLIQDVGQTNLSYAYELLAQYVQTVQKTGNRRWTHILLINAGKGYESLNHYSEADSIFRRARQNARPVPLLYCQALTYTVQLYFSWDKPDSLTHYLALGERAARVANDRETLSFMYMFRATSGNRSGNRNRMRADYDEAIRLATGLPNKNALFMARSSRASSYLTQPQQQVMAFDSLLELAQDSTLARNPRFYERTTIYYRNPRPSLYFKLAQLNLLLTDYDNAGRFADIMYDLQIRPNPTGPTVPYINAEMAIIRVYQKQIGQARAFVDSSRRQFGGEENQIPYSGYFLAAGLLAEHDGKLAKAADYYRQSLNKGATSASFSPIPPELYYARALVRTGNYAKATQTLLPLTKAVDANRFSATGLYYYQTLAELKRAEGNYKQYGETIGTYYAIRDSLTNLNQYRAVQQILARVRIRDKEQQILQLNVENAARQRQLQRERLFGGIIIALAILAVGLLILSIRNQQVRTRQREALQQSQLEQLEKQRHIDLMTGVMEAETRERLTIADELHNDVNPMLAVALLNVSSALETVPTNAPTGPKLRRAQDVLASVTSAVRGISHRLTPQLIEQQGFRRAVEDLAESINLSEKVRMRAIVVGFETALPLPFLSDLYRIVQELVHNVIKHAQATEATIEVIEHDRHITIMVEDNGIGIAPDITGDGQGLQTIRAKVALRHGQMDVQHGPNGGTLVVIDNLQFPQIS